MSTAKRAPFAFTAGEQVRVRGSVEEQLMLHGRMVAGAVGIVVRPTRRSQGMNRYLVHFPRHIYVTRVRRQEHPIEAHDTVLREDHIEHVAPEERVRVCRVCGCTDEWGCEEGCFWMESDLCSSCAGATSTNSGARHV